MPHMYRRGFTCMMVTGTNQEQGLPRTKKVQHIIPQFTSEWTYIKQLLHCAAWRTMRKHLETARRYRRIICLWSSTSTVLSGGTSIIPYLLFYKTHKWIKEETNGDSNILFEKQLRITEVSSNIVPLSPIVTDAHCSTIGVHRCSD